MNAFGRFIHGVGFTGVKLEQTMEHAILDEKHLTKQFEALTADAFDTGFLQNVEQIAVRTLEQKLKPSLDRYSSTFLNGIRQLEDLTKMR